MVVDRLVRRRLEGFVRYAVSNGWPADANSLVYLLAALFILRYVYLGAE